MERLGCQGELEKGGGVDERGCALQNNENFSFLSVWKSSKIETQGRRDVCGEKKNLEI